MAIEIDIDETLKKMDALPEQKSKKLSTKQEAIKALDSGIKAMKKKGYSLPDIADFLTKNGLKISSATLKNYLQKKPRVTKQPPLLQNEE